MGDTTTYCALRFDPADVLPKCATPASASTPIWCSLALPGAAADESTHVPASTPPFGYATCATLPEHDVAPG